MEGSPADKAGLLNENRILCINGDRVENLDHDQVGVTQSDRVLMHQKSEANLDKKYVNIIFVFFRSSK